MIIDTHTHGSHGEYFENLVTTAGEWGQAKVDYAVNYAKKKPMFIDIPYRMKLLDQYHYDYQVVTPQWTFDSNLCPGRTARKLSYARALNDNMAKVMEDSQGRLLAIGTVPLDNYERYGRAETERAIKGLGLKGIFVSTNFKGKPIDLPEYDSFWSHVEELGIPIIIHPGDPATSKGRPYEAEYDLMHNFGWPFETQLTLGRLVFSGMMERHPGLKIIGHHVGGGLPILFGRTLETYTNLPARIGHDLPKPVSHYFSLFYYDTAIGGSAPAVKCAVEVFGIDKVIFATDAPFGPGSGEMRLKTYPAMINSLPYSEEDKNKIFSENARKLFKI